MDFRRIRLTLPRFFLLVVGVLGVLAAVVLSLAVETARDAVVHAGEAARSARASRVASDIEAELMGAEQAMGDFEQAIANRVVDDSDAESVRRYLSAELIALRGLTELTLTVGSLEHYDADGDALLAAAGRWQLSLFRDSNGKLQQRKLEGFAPGGPLDPTRHDTFRAAAREAARGDALWSDLAYSELDASLPPLQRRKTMSVQKAIFVPGAGSAGRFVGVLRAGIVSDTLDRIGLPHPGDPHRLFIADQAGRLVTRLSPGDEYGVIDENGNPDPDGDLRVLSRNIPASVAAALSFAHAGHTGAKRMWVGGEPCLLTLQPIAEGRTQGWLVGLVVPESYYVGGLAATRDRLLMLLGAVVVAIAAAALLGARTIRRGVRALVSSTEAMRHFTFTGAQRAVQSPFGEIQAALESVELAKTALRAMVKYVPIDLVRRLYESGRDPVLGAELMPVTLMFTDIADFTSHAEALAPDQLARALGRYLEAATRAVESTGGTVDKYIGDALMVLWNAPSPLPDHPAAACRAALECARAIAALAQSEWWQAAALPPWGTRFGLHTDQVLVGNFGAPERLSYTAMGDGVNLAARLEGLNKVYGTTILVSEAVRSRAGNDFVFRQVDRVAVKGKKQAVLVYELCGFAADPAVQARRASIARYEAALAAMLERRFEQAREAFCSLPGDGPARELAKRCQLCLTTPPSDDWDGSWNALSK